LTHASRHRWRSIPALHRIAWLRRRLDADERPFAPIEPKPLRFRRHWRLLRELKALEARLLVHADSDVSQVLERRYERHNSRS
jgi:hypothetical protein